MMSCERNSTASFAVDSLAGSCVNVAHCLLRTAYLEILVEEDSRGLHRRCLYRYVILHITVQA